MAARNEPGAVPGIPERAAEPGFLQASAHEEAARRQGAQRFVGRESELHQLLRAVPLNAAPASSSWLIVGPAGIGKTRLCTEFAEQATARGAAVLWGRCWSGEASPAFWPWTQIMRSLLGQSGSLDLAGLLLEEPEIAEPFQLFDATASALLEAAASQALVLILEDLHEADPSSLTLLRYLSRALAGSGVMLLATARSVEERTQECFEKTLQLQPLDREALRQYFGGRTQAEIDAAYTASGGIPLLMEQLDHAGAAASGLQASGAGSVLDAVLQRRLGALAEPVRRMLTALAALGDGSSERLAAVLEVPDSELAEALRPAMQARLVIVADPGARVHFSHQLVRDAVLNAAAEQTLAELHGRISRILPDDALHIAKRARHLVKAGPGYALEAARACRAAAREAAEQLAYEDAVELYRLALEVLPGAGADGERVATGIALAQVLWRAGEHAAARDASTRAWAQAETLGDPELLAEAALGPKFGFDFSGDLPYEIARRCSIALLGLPEAATGLRVRVLASLALARLVHAPEQAIEAAASAMRAAEELGDPAALGYALVAQSAADLSPSTLHWRLRSARRILAIADDTAERALVSSGWFLLLGALVELGDIQGLDKELGDSAPVLARFSELQDGRHSSWFRSLRAILAGEVERAEQLLSDALQRAQREHDPDGLSVWAAQLCLVRWMQGRLPELEPLMQSAVQASPQDAVWTASLAWLWVRLGRHDAAAGMVAAVGDPARIPVDRNWLATVVILAESVAALGERSTMVEVAALLRPYAGRLVPIGLGVAFWGTVDRALALLAAGLGHTEQAVAHYRAAIEVCARAGAHPWLAQAQHELADILLTAAADAGAPARRRAPFARTAGVAEAMRLLGEARAAAEALEWPGVADEVAAVLERHGLGLAAQPLPLPSHVGAVADVVPRIQVLGRFEVRSPAGEQVRWTSRRARTLLKILIARRGRPISRGALLDLLWPGVAHHALANRLSVALTAVRRALDPDRRFALQHFLRFDGESLSLNIQELDIDVESFLMRVEEALASPDAPSLDRAVRAYRGEAFADEFDALWAEPLREQAATAYRDVAHALALQADPTRAAELYRSLLAANEFDLQAQEGLASVLVELGALHQAEAAQQRAEELEREIGA